MSERVLLFSGRGFIADDVFVSCSSCLGAVDYGEFEGDTAVNSIGGERFLMEPKRKLETRRAAIMPIGIDEDDEMESQERRR